MSIPVLGWVAGLVALASILHLRLAFAAPGVTLTVPVPLAVVAVLAAAIAVVLVLACRAVLRPGDLPGARRERAVGCRAGPDDDDAIEGQVLPFPPPGRAACASAAQGRARASAASCAGSSPST